ncbi:RNA methyltransferase, partial [Arthrobacter deserti]|nr:RNA methyltransferase [Arthrobacter deserti]
LNNALKAFKELGIFVLGLDGDGDVSLPGLQLATEPVCIVVGSEGKGLSRLVRENCDQIVSIPIDSEMESLNASMAVGISLYEVSRQRPAR